ncbi:MAG TPA: hypothetical protein VL944_03285 [Candidatus Acidoferrum sp.]|nr:hypothetical protein [Candidatus Acidoferrum sp.]
MPSALSQAGHLATTPLTIEERMRHAYVSLGVVGSFAALQGRAREIAIEEKVATFVLNNVEHTIRRNPNGGGWYGSSPGIAAQIGFDVEQGRDSIVLRSSVGGKSHISAGLVLDSNLQSVMAYGSKAIVNTVVSGCIEMDGSVTRVQNAKFVGTFRVAPGIYEEGTFTSERATIEYQKTRLREQQKRLRGQSAQPGFWSKGSLTPEEASRVDL